MAQQIRALQLQCDQMTYAPQCKTIRQLKEQLAEQKESFDRLTAELSLLRKDQKQQGAALKRMTSKDVLQQFKTNVAAKPDSTSAADRELKL